MPEAQAILAIIAGIALAAACGFRVFVPMLVVSIGIKAGYITVGSGWTWMGDWPAVLAFAVATVLEIGAYYIPWLDNLLDSIATPAAVVAGTVVAASFITGVHPMLKWVLAVVAGGGAAGSVQLATVSVRALSTATTGGLANPVVATFEWIGATALSILALVVPIVAVAALVLVGFVLVRLLVTRRRQRNLVAVPVAQPVA